MDRETIVSRIDVAIDERPRRFSQCHWVTWIIFQASKRAYRVRASERIEASALRQRDPLERASIPARRPRVPRKPLRDRKNRTGTLATRRYGSRHARLITRGIAALFENEPRGENHLSAIVDH